jgi:glutamyl-tRNA reductase
MSIALIGVARGHTPDQVLQRCAVGADQLSEVLQRLAKSDHVAEIVVVSTCLRTEIYVETVRFHGAVRDCREALAHLSGESIESMSDMAFELYEDTAYCHLFRVVSGLESSVTGEPEVLGQVARAWAVAREAGTSKAVLNSLFRRAVEVGKRARTDTAIARGTTSVGQAAVAMAKERLGDLTHRRALLIGAGDMGNSMAIALASARNGVDVTVVNRSAERAIELAGRVGAETAPFDQISSLLGKADLVLTSTGSPEPIITTGMVQAALHERQGDPLVIVDVAVPPDVEVGVRAIDGVTVLDMSDLDSFAEVGRIERAAEVVAVEALIDEEVARYAGDVTSRTITPVLSALREKVEAMRDRELERQGKRLNDLDSATAQTVDSIVNAVVAKLLHEPTVRLKAVAGTPEAERITDAIRYLFDI